LIGLYFFEENVNRVNFLELLRDILSELVKNVDLATRRRMWIQLDGTPLHYAHVVRNYLNTHYNGMDRTMSRCVTFSFTRLNISWFLLMGISQECCLCTTVNNERKYDSHPYCLCSLVEFYFKR